ncbi:hypothetical protein [Chondromyces apiculatus]|uniref:Uncharacterized protein n=1 Tax=Chondromyces apiculatus DSM 436 TaxID=1192034 RepID=A0A017T3W8_9BACT|nr:hypothetical protein [Chondromyces apiculatus]EYF03515.1 Hypothetical protein CAP_5499 [Chondromyces apiculatus DSM 436]
MRRAPGHEPGHEGVAAPPGYTWADYLEHLVEAQGSLAAVALRLSSLASTPEDPGSIERALRRLRRRGHLDGGLHGRRLVRAFGLPVAVEARLKWMGVYHSRFTDLPRSLCLDQLRLWDRPPVSGARARVWVELGLSSVALRGRDMATAGVHLRRARAVPGASPAARVEACLCEAFLASKQGERARAEAALAEVGRVLGEEGPTGLAGTERACLQARWVDQQAYWFNHPREGEAPDHEGALRLYEGIADEEVDPFVSYRRDAGKAYARWRLGDRGEAIRLAESACRHAGDGGFLRLRVMGLHLLARILGEVDGASARARALSMAQRLEDEELLGRITGRASASQVSS